MSPSFGWPAVALLSWRETDHFQHEDSPKKYFRRKYQVTCPQRKLPPHFISNVLQSDQQGQEPVSIVWDMTPSQGHCDALTYQTLHTTRNHLSTQLLWAVLWLLRCCQGRRCRVLGMGLMQPGRTSYNDPQVSFQFRVPRKPLLLTSLSDYSTFETPKIRKILHSSFQQEKSLQIFKGGVLSSAWPVWDHELW